MWTISNKQMTAITESLVKVANKITEKAINKGVDAINNAGKDNSNDDRQATPNNQHIPTSKMEDSKKISPTGLSAQKNNSKSSKTQQTTEAVMPCEMVEVIDVTEEEGLNANNNEFNVIIYYKEDGKDNDLAINNQNLNLDVLSQVRFVAQYEKDKLVEDNNIEWYIEIGTDKRKKLENVKEIIGNDGTKRLLGNKIFFPIPKEWGRKNITFIAKLESKNVEKRIQLHIKDHIVAAFFRLDTEKKRSENIHVKEKKGGTPTSLFYHHQGLYKENKTYYISVSTFPSTPSYTYILGDKQGVVEFDRDPQMKEYTHPGGIQVAEGILAVGLEQYTKIPITTNEKSLICFFDINDETPMEYELLRMPQDNNRASALGIVKKGSEWIVANRGSNCNIDFYKMTQADLDTNVAKRLPIIDSFSNVGDFQNINLFLDEKEDIYLFGMGIEGREGLRETYVYQVYQAKDGLLKNYDDRSESGFVETGYFESFQGGAVRPSSNYRSFHTPIKTISEQQLPGEFSNLNSLFIPNYEGKYMKYRPTINDLAIDVIVYKYPLKVPTPESQNICRIFKVKEIGENKLELESVWIGEDGMLKKQLYNKGAVNNFLRFNCAISQSFIPDTDPSFHWASCLHLDKPEKGSGLEFKGKFTLYAVGAGVIGTKEKKIKAVYFEEKK